MEMLIKLTKMTNNGKHAKHAMTSMLITSTVQILIFSKHYLKIMQKQNEITEMLFQERLSTLPPKEILVVKGNPLQYMTFSPTSEHCIEDKTNNDCGRLFFLDQYTKGQPRVLVRSCLPMEPKKGYNKAKQLLQQHFGNDVLIASPYQEKALNWPMLKSKDRTALQEYALFMHTCGNTMIDTEALNDMYNTSHMQTLVSKFPFKLIEKWRSVAYEHYEYTKGGGKFM